MFIFKINFPPPKVKKSNEITKIDIKIK